MILSTPTTQGQEGHKEGHKSQLGSRVSQLGPRVLHFKNFNVCLTEPVRIRVTFDPLNDTYNGNLALLNNSNR